MIFVAFRSAFAIIKIAMLIDPDVQCNLARRSLTLLWCGIAERTLFFLLSQSVFQHDNKRPFIIFIGRTRLYISHKAAFTLGQPNHTMFTDQLDKFLKSEIPLVRKQRMMKYSQPVQKLLLHGLSARVVRRVLDTSEPCAIKGSKSSSSL